MSKQASPLYEFGPFQLDAAEHLLRRGGGIVPLTPKAFETLLALIEGGGRTLGKEILMGKVWPGTFVEEGNLSVTIFMLRKALGEAEGGQKYIETVPKRGYRFVAPVRPTTQSDVEPGDQPPPPRLKPARTRSGAAAPSGGIPTP
ncbi:MAG: winged helix-turn-helix domain-containing protein, partial [Pyrinomonadaceae bacterium]